MSNGKSGPARYQWAALRAVISAIQAPGRLAVIAHPRRYDLSATERRNLFDEFRALGGQGMEVHSGSCSLNDRLNYAQAAARHSLLASAGSDFHRPHDYSGGVLGACPELPGICQPVWEHFKQPFRQPA